MLKIGSHVSFKSPSYLVGAVEESINNGANTMMIYLGPPQSARRVDKEKFNKEQYLKNYSHFIKPNDVIVHAPYILNLANPEKSQFAKQFLIEEIQRMDYLGFKYLVLHPGASLDYDREVAINELIKNLKNVLDSTKNSNVEIVLETMSGKGSEIGKTLEEIAQLVIGINDPRVGVCLDTCHLWDAGYNLEKDFETQNLTNDFFNKLEKLNLINLIKVIHLNDSKNSLNSHKDRHENLGQGAISLKALINFANHPRFDNIPVILETPFKEGIYKQEIALIKKNNKI